MSAKRPKPFWLSNDIMIAHYAEPSFDDGDPFQRLALYMILRALRDAMGNVELYEKHKRAKFVRDAKDWMWNKKNYEITFEMCCDATGFSRHRIRRYVLDNEGKKDFIIRSERRVSKN
jgi:hypothetical protein